MRSLYGTFGGILYAINYMITRSSFVEIQKNIGMDIAGFDGNSIAFFFTITYAICQIPCGILIDKLGIKFLGLVLNSFLTIGSVICTMSNNAYLFIIGRMITAIGCGGAFIMLIKLAQQVISKENFSRFIGIVMGVSCILTMLVIAFIIPKLSWRMILLSQGIFGSISMLLFLFHKAPLVQNEVKTNTNEKKLGMLCLLKNTNVLLLAYIMFFSCVFYYSFGETTYLGSILQNRFNLATKNVYNTIIAGFLVGGFLGSFLEKILGTRKGILFINVISVLSIFLLKLPFLYVIYSNIFFIGFSTCIQFLITSLSREYVAENMLGATSGLLNLFAALTAPFAQFVLPRFIIRSPEQNNLIFSFAMVFAVLSVISTFFIMKKKKA